MSLPSLRSNKRHAFGFGALSLSLSLFGACSESGDKVVVNTDRDASSPATPSELRAPAPSAADVSRSVVQRGPRVEVSRAGSSLPLSQLAAARAARGEREEDEHAHDVMRLPKRADSARAPALDRVLQSDAPAVSMPVTLQNFLGQGLTLSPGVAKFEPPDANGAVGPHHFVQVVNAGIGVWNKDGSVAVAPTLTKALWTGYVGTNAGNGCSTRNDGDPVVLYDQLADRWLITQFSLPNTGTNGGPSFQCVGLSKTGDPTGSYWLYDFKYDQSFNDYGKLGVWPDAYYATFDMFNASLFNASAFTGVELCAYDRVSMLAGLPSAQQCFLQAAPTTAPPCPAPQPFRAFGVLPASVDGKVKPPIGAPGFFLQYDASQCAATRNKLDLWKFHVDWATPASTTLTGPTELTVADFSVACPTSLHCIPQPGTPVTLDSIDEFMMFRLTYRNFGTHESLLANHTVGAGAGSGIRWYEIRSPRDAPTIFQQGTYAPNDSNWRFMGSLAQDQAQGFALGFSISSAGAPGVDSPSIAWTGRLASDPPGVMGQGEVVIDKGLAVEQDAYSGQKRGRWGDYSSMTVDPVDDCTFWYTQQIYKEVGLLTWDTYIASFKFPSCGANDFTIAAAPASQNLSRGGTVAYTVTTASSRGSAEAIVLNVQDLPTGVTGAFIPASVAAGSTSTLTLTSTAGAPLTASPAPTFTVIGKSPSAVHAASAQVAVVAGCVANTCQALGYSCGSVPDGCGGTLDCGACQGGQTCASNRCSCQPSTCVSLGATCGTVSDGCGGTLDCGTCGANQTCASNNKCACRPLTCAAQGQNCGTFSDGCGGTLDCGACTSPRDTCVNHLCVCQPKSCQGLCGKTWDGCTKYVDCGGCSAGLTCRGGACCPQSTTCQSLGVECGLFASSCAGTLNCGTCAAGQECKNNKCAACTQATCQAAGYKCGTICSGTIDCGTCTLPETCSGGAKPFQCGCTPTKCEKENAACGTIADKCGGTLDCGTCSGGTICAGNQCVAAPRDAGTPDAGRDAGEPPPDAAAEAGAVNGGATDGGGCGCRTADTRSDSRGLALAGIGCLGWLAAIRRRRRRQAAR